MDTRTTKYENNKYSRVSKNEDLYKRINEGAINEFNLRSNATVIGDQEQGIDIEQIKKILDTKYKDAPKRKSIRVEPEKRVSRVLEETTKEYDLNLVLEKAKDEHIENYQESRNKKLRNTQYDILKDLKLDENKKEEKTPEDNLMELINTITINESIKKEKKEEEDNLLADLIGGDDTEVFSSMSQDLACIKELSDNTAKDIDNSFYTSSVFKKKDFEDEDDFIEEDKTGIWIKILIVLIIIVFSIGLFLFIKSFINI